MDIFLKWHIQMQALVSVIHLVPLLSVKQVKVNDELTSMAFTFQIIIN